jgi:hypothetical protein
MWLLAPLLLIWGLVLVMDYGISRKSGRHD